jgi:hypothetical protein
VTRVDGNAGRGGLRSSVCPVSLASRSTTTILPAQRPARPGGCARGRAAGNDLRLPAPLRAPPLTQLLPAGRRLGRVPGGRADSATHQANAAIRHAHLNPLPVRGLRQPRVTRHRPHLKARGRARLIPGDGLAFGQRPETARGVLLCEQDRMGQAIWNVLFETGAPPQQEVVGGVVPRPVEGVAGLCLVRGAAVGA